MRRKGKQKQATQPQDAPEQTPPADAPAPIADASDAPDAAEDAKRIPRLRGRGPICPKCGSGMLANGMVPRTQQNHPFVRMRYFKCKNPDCGRTIKK